MSASVPLSHRQQAILKARQVLQENPLYLDTETTGLERNDEIVEIAVVDHLGQIVFESLVKPTRPIPPAASRIHGITNDDVLAAPSWVLVWPRVRPLLAGRLIAAYNAEFDLRMLQQTHARCGLPWRENLRTFCIMKLYAQLLGEWDARKGGYRFHSLDSAGRNCGIPMPNAHRAAADTLLARALLEFIAGMQP